MKMKVSTNSLRASFLTYFQSKIYSKEYALIKFVELDLAQISETADIDLAVRKNDLKSYSSIIQSFKGIERTSWVKKSFMHSCFILFSDGTSLDLDFIFKFKRKDKVYLSAKDFIDRAIERHGVKLPCPEHHFEQCWLYYTLNGLKIDYKHDKYKWYYRSFNDEKKRIVKDYMNKKYSLGLDYLEELFIWNDQATNAAHHLIDNNASNRGLRGLINRWQYKLDQLREVRRNWRKPTITFSGVDGAGKTTTLHEIEKRLRARGKVITLRHRPSLLPIISYWFKSKEERSKATKIEISGNPHSGTNSSTLSSVVRFSYYMIDYIFGQLYNNIKYALRGYVIIYDRYYFDFIVDSKRSNIVLDSKWVKALYRLVHKPKLNFFLYADPEVILQRRQQLSEEKILDLTAKYKELFGEFSSTYKDSNYILIENIELDETIDTVMKAYARVA